MTSPGADGHDSHRRVAPDLDPAFQPPSALVQFVPEPAFGIVERENELARRATRRRFWPTPDRVGVRT